MYTYQLVKVVGIRKDTLYWGWNGESDFKRVEVIEQIGWWMNRFVIEMYPHSPPYNHLQIGDELSIVSNPYKHETYARVKFDECPMCSAYYRDCKHECPSQNDSIKVDGEGEILSAERNISGSKARLLIKYMDIPFTFDYILPYVYEFEIGEKVKLDGWFRKDSKEFMVYINIK